MTTHELEKLQEQLQEVNNQLSEIRRILLTPVQFSFRPTGGNSSAAALAAAQPPPSQAEYTVGGWKVGDRCFLVWVDESAEDSGVFPAKVVGLSRAENSAQVLADGEKDPVDAELTDIFHKKSLAEHRFQFLNAEAEKERLRKVAWKARVLVLAFDNPSMKTLKELGNRELTSMAAVVGLTLKERKGKTPDEWRRMILKKANEKLSQRDPELVQELRAARTTLKAWEANEKAEATPLAEIPDAGGTETEEAHSTERLPAKGDKLRLNGKLRRIWRVNSRMVTIRLKEKGDTEHQVPVTKCFFEKKLEGEIHLWTVKK